ncbi:EamA family transporter [Paraburkholderia gardini]|uniref:EamA family transporter n=1 Tax=Paraburkholderia gardini TaxID=2823469 RepID=UPI001D4AF4C2|nr:EamA family transporter [Paraburkholderia gardini]CAG4919667.1 Threonine/homoserine exporter RhtA [Paraburkholderia gardini]
MDRRPLPHARSVIAERVPPHAWFVISAVFHYLGPSFAVMLFAHIAPLGVAWLRITSAAIVFAIWRRPWRYFAKLTGQERWLVVSLGAVLAAMNSLFYLAINALPLGTVGAIEFLGPIGLAAFGARSARNVAALIVAGAGVYILTDVRIAGAPLAYLYAFANCALFIVYIVLGHRISGEGGIDRLGLSMLIAMIAALPFGIHEALPAFRDFGLLAAAIGVGISSSVIPYVTDQLAMARLARATFALLLSILPATATAIGFLVLAQKPTLHDLTGIGLVIVGIALHRAKETH